MYGGVYRETVILTHADLWCACKVAELPDVSDQLPRMRELLLARREPEAQPLMRQALTDRVTGDRWPAKPAKDAEKALATIGNEQLGRRWEEGERGLLLLELAAPAATGTAP